MSMHMIMRPCFSCNSLKSVLVFLSAGIRPSYFFFINMILEKRCRHQSDHPNNYCLLLNLSFSFSHDLCVLGLGNKLTSQNIYQGRYFYTRCFRFSSLDRWMMTHTVLFIKDTCFFSNRTISAWSCSYGKCFVYRG